MPKKKATKKSKATSSLPPTQREKVLKYLKGRQRGVTAGQIAKAIGASMPRTCTLLKQMTENAEIYREGTRVRYTYWEAA